MTQGQVTDEMLMAFVDGELNETDAGRIEALISADPALEARAEKFLQSRLLVREALAGGRDEPAPPHLVAGILGTGQDLEPRGFRGRQWAMAASVAVVAAAAGFLANGLLPASPGPSSLMAAATGSAVLSELAGVGAGESLALDMAGRNLTASVVGTYPVDQGFCRLFTLSEAAEQVRALACGQGETWSVPVAVLEGSEGFQPASGAEAIDVYLDSAGAGAALDADAERAAQAAGWAP